MLCFSIPGTGVPGSEVLCNENEENYDAAAAVADAGAKQGRGWVEGKGAWSLGGGSMPRAVEIAVPRISILQHGVCTLYYAYRMRSWLTRGLGYSA